MVSSEYARAAFELASEKNILNDFYDDFRYVKRGIWENKEIYKLFDSPKITTSEKKDVVKKITEGLNKYLVDFLYVLVDNNRFLDIIDIYYEFKKLFLKEKSVVSVEIISSKKLSSSNLTAISETLEKRYKGQKLRIKNVIDNSLLGGIKIVCDGESIDLSLQGKLDSLKASL